MPRDTSDEPSSPGNDELPAPRRLPTATKTLVGITPVQGDAAAIAARATVRGMPAARTLDTHPPPPRREGRHGEDLAFLTGLRDRLLPMLDWMARGPKRELLGALADGELALVEETLEEARRDKPRHLEITAAANELRRAMGDLVERRLGSGEAVPLRAREPNRPGPSAQRLLANVNGVSTVEDVLMACGLPFAEAVRGLAELADAGHLVIPGRAVPPASSRVRGGPTEPPPRSDRSTMPEILAPFAADLRALGIDGNTSPRSYDEAFTPVPASSRVTAPPPPLAPASGDPLSAELARAILAAAEELPAVLGGSPSLRSVPPPATRSAPPAPRASERPAAPSSVQRLGRRSEPSEPPPSIPSSSVPPTNPSWPPPTSVAKRPASLATSVNDRSGTEEAATSPSSVRKERERPGATRDSTAPSARREATSESAPPAPPSSRAAPRAPAESLPPRTSSRAAPASIWMKVSTAASLAALAAGGLALYRSGQTAPTMLPNPTEVSVATVAVAATVAAPHSAPPAAPTPPPRPTPEVPAVAPPETILLSVRVNPKYARVLLDGVLLSPTTETRIRRQTDPRQVRVEAPGFVSQEFTLKTEKDTELAVTLRRKDAPPTPLPTARLPEPEDPYR